MCLNVSTLTLPIITRLPNPALDRARFTLSETIR
nr:MAG TPA: hypothetical protein [Caudoviricetes sp.]